MKKLVILITLFAFFFAGAMSVNKVTAKVDKGVKIEMVKHDQIPVKAKEGDTTKKVDQPKAAPDMKSSREKSSVPATNAPKSNVKPNYPPAKKEAERKNSQDPPKK